MKYLSKLKPKNQNYQRPIANMGFAKMGADGSRVSAFVFQFGFISSLPVLISLYANHQLLFINLALFSRADGILFPPLRQALNVIFKDTLYTIMDWRNYEHYIYNTYKEKYPTSKIEFNKKIKGNISGRVRQIDLFIEGQVAGETLTVIIDCKYFNKKIDIKLVEAFLGFVKDVKGNRGILITNKGFTKSAFNRANNDQNNDVKLEIIDFKQLYPYQGPGAIIHRDEGGAIIQAPEGWVIDGKNVTNETLCAILPFGLSIEEAAIIKEILFINITLKKFIPTVKDLIEYQDVGLLEFDDKASVKIEDVKLKRYDKLNAIYREIYYPTAGYYDYTIFMDYENFILYAYLVENIKVKGKYFDKLLYVVNNLIPLNVLHNKASY